LTGRSSHPAKGFAVPTQVNYLVSAFLRVPAIQF
jgi:hypothetical protein